MCRCGCQGHGEVEELELAPELFEFNSEVPGGSKTNNKRGATSGPTNTGTVVTGGALGILAPSELKAVRITSTFETGRAGSFGGLTGNFDGQGLSFGLMNFTIKAGSLIPLLQEFITRHQARYAAIFGKDAERFRQMVFATKADPEKPSKRIRDISAQMNFVTKQMNSSNRIIDPWKTYFKGLENDPEFQKIQVKAVRKALDRARYWFNHFAFKTERGFAFMFDLVSSHGGAWLNAPKFKGRRMALMHKMMEARKAKVGRELTELEKMEVIANMIADVSLQSWREKVRVRKLWFVRGKGKVHGSEFDIAKNFGVSDNAPDFGASSSTSTNFSAGTSISTSNNNTSINNASTINTSTSREFETSIKPASITTAPRLIRKESVPPAQTLYVGIRLGAEAPAVPMTGVYIPEGFVPGATVDVILYLHGIKTSPTLNIAQYWNKKSNSHFAFRERMNESKVNAILVAPTLGPRSQWQTGWLTKPGGLDKYLDQVLTALSQHGPYRGNKPSLGNIVLACHSGGGHPMRELALAANKCASRIKECWGFDCTYFKADPTGWPQWARSRNDAKLFLYYRPKSGTAVFAEKIQKATLPNVFVLTSAVEHNWVPIKHWSERLQGSFLTKRT
ncbi:hypothetical protein WBG78_04795 [Chryseolinea sp. T2]|uniref:hypothetical protein n=1 Tax=Chryseolinea sp. T2 TaxID=3129255 RepID=UPI00307727EE